MSLASENVALAATTRATYHRALLHEATAMLSKRLDVIPSADEKARVIEQYAAVIGYHEEQLRRALAGEI